MTILTQEKKKSPENLSKEQYEYNTNFMVFTSPGLYSLFVKAFQNYDELDRHRIAYKVVKFLINEDEFQLGRSLYLLYGFGRLKVDEAKVEGVKKSFRGIINYQETMGRVVQ